MKISLLRSFLFYFFPNRKLWKLGKGEFVFLIHPRKIDDLKKNIPFANLFPEKFLGKIASFLPPIIASEVIVEGKDKKHRGYLIACPIVSEIMLEKRGVALKSINKAFYLAEKLRARIVGLGALTSSVTDGGKKIKTKLFITTGNTFTAKIAFDDLRHLYEENFIKKGIAKEKIEISIVGATGSIGSALAKLLVEYELGGELIFVGKTKEHLDNLSTELAEIKNKDFIKWQVTDEIAKIYNSDIIVMATSSHRAILKNEEIKNGSIIYNISQPSNIDSKIKKRKEILFFDGGYVKTPIVKHKVEMNLPEGVNFACFSETILLGISKTNKNFLGNVNVKDMKKIADLAEEYGFYSNLFEKK